MKKLDRARAQELLQLQIRLQISDNEKLQKAREDQARAREDQAADQAAAESDGAEHVRLMEIEVTIERAKNLEWQKSFSGVQLITGVCEWTNKWTPENHHSHTPEFNLNPRAGGGVDFD